MRQIPIKGLAKLPGGARRKVRKPAIDLLEDEALPDKAVLSGWLEASHGGDGTPWLSDREAAALVLYARDRGEGLRMMEASAPPFHEQPRDIGWEILGCDPAGDNWDDHRDPEKAMDLFRRKLRQAKADGVRLRYKLWFSPEGA